MNKQEFSIFIGVRIIFLAFLIMLDLIFGFDVASSLVGIAVYIGLSFISYSKEVQKIEQNKK